MAWWVVTRGSPWEHFGPTEVSEDAAKARAVSKSVAQPGIAFQARYRVNANAPPEVRWQAVDGAIAEVTGRKPELSTSGGTSDARFISSYCPVIEFGLLGQTMHQVDERASVADMEQLTQIYRGILERYFG